MGNAVQIRSCPATVRRRSGEFHRYAVKPGHHKMYTTRMELTMAAIHTKPTNTVQPIRVPKEAWLAACFAAAFVYLMFSENGAVLTENWEVMHEFFHDGRHIFGVPCH